MKLVSGCGLEGLKAGFTGTRHPVTAFQRSNLLMVLTVLCPSEGHYGDCTGADNEFYMLCRALGVWLVSHPPDVDGHRMFTLPDGVRVPKPPLERNKDIVDETDYLIAVPREQSEVRRSGTWMTVRWAARQGRTVVFLWPDGKVDVQRHSG